MKADSKGAALSPQLLALIDVLAASEVAVYMTVQAAAANDSTAQRPEHVASDAFRKAA